MRHALQGWLTVGLLLGTTAYVVAEQITLVTYYPSPRGVYQELRALSMQVGSIDSPADPAAAPRLHVTREDDDGPVLEVEDQVNDATPLVIDADGNVGIGTDSPTSTLQVQGAVQTQTLEVTGQTTTAALRLTTGAAEGKVLTSDAQGQATWQPPPPTGTYGGIYYKRIAGGVCMTTNPTTGSCTCPAGFVASEIGPFILFRPSAGFQPTMMGYCSTP